MADKIDIHKFFPNIPNIAEDFKKKHFSEEHTLEEWWEIFREYLEDVDVDDD